MNHITKHTQNLLPQYEMWQDVAYYQPIEAAIDAWVSSGCPSPIRTDVNANDLDVDVLISHKLATFFLYLYSLNLYLEIRPYILSKASNRSDLEWVIENMNLLFENVRPLQRSITVYRGVNKDLSSEKNLIQNTYSSFSLSKEIANFFRFDQTGQTSVENGEKEPGTLIVLKLPIGAKILPIFLVQNPDMQNEEEVLLPLKYKLSKVSQKGHVVYCKLTETV